MATLWLKEERQVPSSCLVSLEGPADIPKVVTFKKHNASSKVIHILNHAIETIPFYANKQLKSRTADVASFSEMSSVCVEKWWAT